MNKKIKLLTILLASLSLIGCNPVHMAQFEVNPKENNISSPEEYYDLISQEESYIYFYKDDCPYCHVFEDFLGEILAENPQLIYSYDIDANDSYDENEQIMEDNGIGTVPKFVLYDNGNIVDSIDHNYNYYEIEEFLDREDI